MNSTGGMIVPRAENRKRPPNLSGSGFAGGARNKSYNNQHVSEAQVKDDKKQALIEKMKKLQSKKSEQQES